MNNLAIIIIITLLTITNTLMTTNMARKKAINLPLRTKPANSPLISTSCSTIDLSSKYNYSGIVATGYLSVGRGNSALAFTFYGKKNIKTKS